MAISMGPSPASAGESQPASDNALVALCGIVEASAKAKSLPLDFFIRLIWQESAFQPRAVSPAGAMGVAQFMPGTASERGLADPFDPAAAIPESAKLLAELKERFGNLGLAAAAYNAGPNATANWLAGKATLPLETQDYVLAVTGHDVEDWRGEKPPEKASPDPPQSCLAEIGRLRIARIRAWPASATISGIFAPWGVQVAGSFSKTAALGEFTRVEKTYAGVIGGMNPFVLGTVLRSRGFRPFYRVRLPAQSRDEADKICNRLLAAGGACVVLKS
ncbi:MAG: lytic transglycosylase domain-containing protein [Hyphomicrobiales bacterium]|nr:lytic transglycosylase domain-containing protein [Hyphomicrobiales bacterium]